MESRIPHEPVAEASPSTPEETNGGQETLDKLRQMAAAQAREADRLVRQHPYESIGIAAGLGLLVGFLISRR